MFLADDAQQAVRIFLDRRPPSIVNLSSACDGDHGREQSDHANAQPTSARAKVAAVEEPAPAAHGGGAEEDYCEGDIADIEAVLSQQICDMKKLQIDPKDIHRAAAVAEIQRLERLRLELIEKEKERQRLLAAQQAARDAEEKQRLQHLANLIQQENQRRLREERERQQLNERLRRIGKCPVGYAWIREGNGYVCEGGSHRVSDGQL
jgi:hypothetical protein